MSYADKVFKENLKSILNERGSNSLTLLSHEVNFS